MKKILKITLMIISLLIIAGYSCSKTPESVVAVQYLTTILGGCNNEFATRNYSEETDTVVISIADDNNIHVFVGKNYTCKSVPFETRCEIIDDVIVMYIIDVGGIYYRCDCYYTFDFVFKQGELNQKYKIILIDPRKETPEIIEENNFQNKLTTK